VGMPPRMGRIAWTISGFGSATNTRMILRGSDTSLPTDTIDRNRERRQLESRSLRIGL
jgi:hypothetical protein